MSELEVTNLKRLEMIEKQNIFCISCLCPGFRSLIILWSKASLYKASLINIIIHEKNCNLALSSGLSQNSYIFSIWAVPEKVKRSALTSSLKRDKEIPQWGSAFPENIWWLLKVYGPIIIIEIFSDLKWILKITSKFVFSQFA